MAVQLKTEGECLFAYLSGEIDHHSAAEMRFFIDGELERATPKLLVMDFGGVDFMDSSGIGLILGRIRTIAGWNGRIMVVNAKPPVRKMIRIAGLDRLIAVRKG